MESQVIPGEHASKFAKTGARKRRAIPNRTRRKRFRRNSTERFWHLPWPGKLTWVPYLIGFPVVAISCTLILLAILGIAVRPPAILVHLGKISYGLYVYHLLGMHLAKLVLQGHLAIRQVLALLITILLASASYAFLEKPFLKLKKRFELVGSRPV